MRRIDVAIAVVCRLGQVLICRRKADDRFGGFWEFPGGKVEDGETPGQCLAREVREELDIEVELIRALPIIEHDYPDIRVRLYPFLCIHEAGQPKPIGCQQAIWVDPPDLRNYQFPPANRQLIEDVVAYLLAGRQLRANEDTDRSD